MSSKNTLKRKNLIYLLNWHLLQKARIHKYNKLNVRYLFSKKCDLLLNEFFEGSSNSI